MPEGLHFWVILRLVYFRWGPRELRRPFLVRMMTEKCNWSEPCVYVCPNIFWLWRNTPVRAVRIYLSGDPNHGLDLSRVQTEHVRTMEAEKDHRRPTP